MLRWRARAPVGTSEMIFNVDLVDCAQPHESELIASFEYTGDSTGTYPGDSELAGYAEDECLERFTAYVGVTYYASSLELTYLHPTSASWVFGDRSMQCVVHPPVGQDRMTGTVRDSRR